LWGLKAPMGFLMLVCSINIHLYPLISTYIHLFIWSFVSWLPPICSKISSDCFLGGSLFPSEPQAIKDVKALERKAKNLSEDRSRCCVHVKRVGWDILFQKLGMNMDRSG
jgi:hypothetical protein